ncbi:hypothetical protein [Herbaspirillum autotrophicum]|uniref:hypothetical protein n=1 Tax=Herbaspirillum autotrophicum TaxID=180195 RepID=UPI0012EE7ECA|nr:hypothetical protein [Herbaspirillum autotrophicum]
MMLISSVPALSAAALAPRSVTPAANDGNTNPQRPAPMTTASQVDLTASRQRISSLAAAGDLYHPAAGAPLHEPVAGRQKRFVPTMLASEEITTNVIDEVSAAIHDNTVGDALIDHVTAADDALFSGATLQSAAFTGLSAGREAGRLSGAFQGGASGAREGALAGATRGAIAGGIMGGTNGALGGIMASHGEPEGAVWGEMAGTTAGRFAGRTLGHIIGATAGREAGAQSGSAFGMTAGGIAGQKAGILAGRMVTDMMSEDLLQHLPLEDRDDLVQFWHIAERHEHAAAVSAREIAAHTAHQVGDLAGKRAGMLAGLRIGQEIGGREGELAGAQAGNDAGYLAGMRAGGVIDQLARHPNRQTHVSQGVEALLLAPLPHG